MTKILRASWFSLDSKGHGGNRRSLQIHEILGSSGFTIEDTQLNPSIRLQRRLQRSFTNLDFINQYNF
ncbi:MAG: hypothetical protein HC908_16080 [Calothrix sp. SM1_7_51]|nr:hypothetical protein [Calothrix sp. SM1_7_51]